MPIFAGSHPTSFPTHLRSPYASKFRDYPKAIYLKPLSICNNPVVGGRDLIFNEQGR